MKYYLLGAAIILAFLSAIGMQMDKPAPAVPPSAPTVEVKPFEFRGLKPGVTTRADAKAADTIDYCRSEDSCELARSEIGDVGVYDSRVVFRGGRFDWLTVNFNPARYDDIVPLLNRAYGKPCAVETRRLYGRPADGAAWCFKEGRLLLHRYEDFEHLDRGVMQFFTRHPEEAVQREEVEL